MVLIKENLIQMCLLTLFIIYIAGLEDLLGLGIWFHLQEKQSAVSWDFPSHILYSGFRSVTWGHVTACKQKKSPK